MKKFHSSSNWLSQFRNETFRKIVGNVGCQLKPLQENHSKYSCRPVKSSVGSKGSNAVRRKRALLTKNLTVAVAMRTTV